MLGLRFEEITNNPRIKVWNRDVQLVRICDFLKYHFELIYFYYIIHENLSI